MNKVLILPACALALALGSAKAMDTPPLGRLFMTPEMRTALERQRAHNVQQTRNLEGGSMRVDGVVVRSSGKTTVWVNNQPTDRLGIAATPSQRHPERVTLGTGTESPAEVKVGATHNRATGETSGALADGEIQIHRSSRSR